MHCINILYLFQNNHNYLPSNFFFSFQFTNRYLYEYNYNARRCGGDRNHLVEICLINLPQIPKGINHCYYCYLAIFKELNVLLQIVHMKYWIQKSLILQRYSPKLLEHFIQFNTMEEFIRASFEVNGLGVIGFYSILRIFKNAFNFPQL